MELKLTPRFLQNGQRFFGPGVAELLERVREHRSLRAAAASMETELLSCSYFLFYQISPTESIAS